MQEPEISGIDPLRPLRARRPVGARTYRATAGSAPIFPASSLDDVDMTGVDPLRIEEVRRRVAAVKSYVQIPQPMDSDRRRHARTLGLSVNQFLALVRAWKEHGQATAIAGAGTARGAPRSPTPRTLPTVSKDAAREVVTALGPDVPHVEAVRAVKARCVSLGVKAPSRSTIWNIVMSSRRDLGQKHGSDDVVISRCHVKLPMEHEDEVVFPLIMLVVDGQNGAIIAAAMNQDGASFDSIVPPLTQLSIARRIIVDQDIAKELSGGKLPAHVAVRPSAARTATARALGRGFGSVDVTYQISRAIDPKRLLRSRKDKALSPRDARQVILEQLTTHNAARGAPPPIVNWEG